VLTGEEKVQIYHNKICTAGLAYLCQWLNGELSVGNPTSAIYGAVGIGTGTLQATDTILFNELARTAVATNSRSGASQTYDFFYTTSMANPTPGQNLLEAGLFLNASGTLGSGQLLSHVAINSQKTNTITLTMEFNLSFVGNT
jgi:cytolysin (calcineurin-like family phosphatase)